MPRNDSTPGITKLRDRIEFAKRKLIEAERDGDDKAAEAWGGYINALRWVESELSEHLTG